MREVEGCIPLEVLMSRAQAVESSSSAGRITSLQEDVKRILHMQRQHRNEQRRAEEEARARRIAESTERFVASE